MLASVQCDRPVQTEMVTPEAIGGIADWHHHHEVVALGGRLYQPDFAVAVFHLKVKSRISRPGRGKLHSDESSRAPSPGGVPKVLRAGDRGPGDRTAPPHKALIASIDEAPNAGPEATLDQEPF